MAISRKMNGVYGLCSNLECKMTHRSQGTSCPFNCSNFERYKTKSWQRRRR